MTVTIKPTDAHRLRELNRLRGELAAAAETVRRLELENESLRENRSELRAELIEIKENSTSRMRVCANCGCGWPASRRRGQCEKPVGGKNSSWKCWRNSRKAAASSPSTP